MGSKMQAKKSSEFAKQMRDNGIWHGRRMTTPLHNNMPVNEAGSAAYRRLQRRKMKMNLSSTYGKSGLSVVTVK